MKISEHPFYERLRSVSAKEAASWVLGDQKLEDASLADRKLAFKKIGRTIIAGRTERKKYGFNSDSASEIARALEWAFIAGQKTK